MTSQTDKRTIVTQKPLPGFEHPAVKWEILQIPLQGGHTRVIARQIR